MDNLYVRSGILEVDLRRKRNLEITLREPAAPILIVAVTLALPISAELIDQKIAQQGLEHTVQSEPFVF